MINKGHSQHLTANTRNAIETQAMEYPESVLYLKICVFQLHKSLIQAVPKKQKDKACNNAKLKSNRKQNKTKTIWQ